jgi:GTP-binding protein YchF
MKIGIAGLKYSGKTSLFRLLTGIDVSFEKAEVNRGITKVPDDRIDLLSGIYEPKKTTYAQLELVDIPGIDPDNPNNRKFFEDIRKVDLLMLVLRDFDSEMYPNPMKTNDFKRDYNIIRDEMILQDLTLIEKRLENVEKQIKKLKTKELEIELGLLNKAAEILNEGKFLTEMEITEAEDPFVRTYAFFTLKTILPVINTSEDNISVQTEFPAFSIQVESEISELPEDEREMFYEELGIKEPALNRIVRHVYGKAGLISFFTVGKDEVRAWTIDEGTNARKAAGKIHSDLEKGFIRAETCSYSDFLEYKDLNKAKNENKVRLEGKEYTVKDGDILNIRFNL